MPSLALTSVALALTLLWNRRVVFTFVISHASEFVAASGGSFDFQPVVHLFYPGQARHGLVGQCLVGFFGDSPCQGDGAVLGLDLDIIVFEVVLEHI